MLEPTTCTTIGDLVARDLRTATVFARHGIDFCCGGRRSLADACRDQGVDPERLLAELDHLDDSRALDTSNWPLDRLIDHIVSRHHAYVRPCVTWRACYAELAEFERDLHEHVHLENNVLFPAAVRLEESLS